MKSDRLHTVHVRVNDAATGKPTPVRIRFATADGTYFAPLGRLTTFPTEANADVGGNLLLGPKKYAYIDGSCEIALPTGPILVEIHKGPEYRPQVLEVNLGIGQLALRFSVERWTNLRDGRWYSGDTRAFFLSPHAALLEASAEDLAVVNLLAVDGPEYCEYGARTTEEDAAADERKPYRVPTNILAFSGQQPALQTPGHLVVVNTHNEHTRLGSLSLLNCHRVVHPLLVGEDDPLDQWLLADWAQQCHRKGGVVIWDGDRYELGKYDSECYGEAFADLLLGHIDALEVSPDATAVDSNLWALWYELLNTGFRIPLVGTGGKCSNRDVLGAMRTFARLLAGEQLTYRDWIEAIRAGRTIVSGAPLLTFSVNGEDPGAVVNLSAADQPLHVVAAARSLIPFDRLELIFNGEVMHTQLPSGSPPSASVELDLRLPGAGWLALRCLATDVDEDDDGAEIIFAHTSAVYMEINGQPLRPHPDRVDRLTYQLDMVRLWIEEQIPPGGNPQPKRLWALLESARAALQSRVQSGS